MQVQNGRERPVAFASRVLNDAEQGYSVCEKEALACLFACEHWHYYLYGRKFRLRTDHKPLTALLILKLTKSTLKCPVTKTVRDISTVILDCFF